MDIQNKLKSLSDDELLARLSDVLKQSRRVEAVLVAHIAEVDRRRLFAREAVPSMFRYCTDVLHLSEAAAYRRIRAARLSRKYPVVLTMLEDGRIHLCGLALLSKHVTEANYEDVLARATHKTKREIEELVAELAPKPAVPPTIRKRPERKASSNPPDPPSPPSAPSPDKAQPSELPPAPDPPAASKKRPTVKPLAPASYLVQFTANAELRDKLQRLEALMPGMDLASIIDEAVSEKLERLEARRYGKTNKPRKNVEDADTLTGCARYPCPGEACRVGARLGSMHLCHYRRQSMSRTPSTRIPS